MRSLRRRTAYYLLSIAIIILVSSLAYDVAMKTFEPGVYPPEGTEVSLLHSMQVVVETFTATGYGSDSPWKSPQLNLLVMVLDLTGVGLFFLALPAVLLPLFREALSRDPPTAVPADTTDHVVVCTYSLRVDTLIDELEAHGVGYVLVEPDEERAVELDGDGYEVIHGDPESVTDLERTNLSEARALVADVSDQVDASIVLTAKEVDESVTVVSVVEDPDVEPYHRLAGADSILMPRQLLGEALARKLTTDVRTDLGENIVLGEDVQIAEVPIRRENRLAGETLASSRLGERFGVTVIGLWSQGEFESTPSPETTLDTGTIILVAGSANQLERLRVSVQTSIRSFTYGRTVVIGHGAVGQAVTDALSAADRQYTVVDRREAPDVDVVGDATDAEVLATAGVPDARSVVITLPDETATEFATLIVRNLSTEATVSVRAETLTSVGKAYRAGADYVLSLAVVTGRAVASEILEDESILSMDTQVEIVRLRAPGLVGETFGGARVRQRTGCSVVAVERDGEVFANVGSDTRIRPGDTLVVAGTDKDTTMFVEAFG